MLSPGLAEDHVCDLPHHAVVRSRRTFGVVVAIIAEDDNGDDEDGGGGGGGGGEDEDEGEEEEGGRDYGMGPQLLSGTR